MFGRWFALLVASVLLHLLVFGWANGRIGLPSFQTSTPNVVTATLRIPPAQEAATMAPAEPPPPPPKKKARPRPRKRVPPPLPPPAASAAVPEPAGLEVPAPEPAIEDDATLPSAAASEPDQASAPAAEPVPEAVTAYRTDPPPSATLDFKASALRKGEYIYGGSGEIKWETDGRHYSVRGEARVLFLTLLNFKSEGEIDSFGVAPELYSEKRFRKAETNTHFHRERNTISFSASTLSYPRAGGEQDRSSVIWQLASIGRGDAGKFFPDAQFDFFVAGARDGEVWQFRVIGEEEIETGLGNFLAWHVLRVPRPGSYEQKVDIWLAPQQEWYPVKLRYTETNGDYLELLLSKLVSAQ